MKYCLTILMGLVWVMRAATWGAPVVVNDQAVIGRMLQFAEAELEGGRAVKAGELIGQFDRSGCEVGLAAVSLVPWSLPELADRRRAAVGVIGGLFKCLKCSKWHLAAASGFFIGEKGVFVTCAHVIQSADKQIFVVLTGDGRLTSVREVLAADAIADVAIVRCEGAGFSTVPVVAEAAVGSGVTVFGHPNDHFFSLTQGIISRYFLDPRPKVGEMFSITADFAKGSSGSPVFDQSGNVIGMVANTQSIYYGEKDGHAENLQMVIKNCVSGKTILRLIKPVVGE
ncbi:MAG: serine protease [Verrucomicrobia bacterium]|nr:serine protease [Verrucomicrobiota bacterium]